MEISVSGATMNSSARAHKSQLTTDTPQHKSYFHPHQSSNPQVRPLLTHLRILPLQPLPDIRPEHVPMFAVVVAAAAAHDTLQSYQESPYSLVKTSPQQPQENPPHLEQGFPENKNEE